MLVTFKTKSYANITMFGDVAKSLLEVMDFGVAVPGAIVAKDVARALKNLQSGLESAPELVLTEDDDDEDQTEVALHTRAVPLIDLLQSAVQDGNNVMWE